MNLGLVMRSPKFRILLYIITFGGACLMVMLLHNMHSHLKEAENSFAVCQQEKEKCDQGKDSISAQFQVLSEHKKRLEVTLQQERLEHQKEKEGFEKKSIETQAVHSQLQKEMNELQSRYSQLSSDYKSLKETNEQIQTQLADMKESYASLEKEKQNLNLELSTQLQQLHQQEEEVSQLNGQLKMVLMEKQQIEQENAERIKCESNLVSCRKEHQQLMIQFDEVSLNLNNCIIGKNNSKQEILNHPHEHVTRYVKNNIALDAVQKTKQEEEQKDKIVHEEVGKKVRTRYSQNDYAINRSPNSEHLFVHPNNRLHFDQNKQQNYPLVHLMNGVYGIPSDKLLDKPLYHRSGNDIMQNELKYPHGNTINRFRSKHSLNPQNAVDAFHYLMPHPHGGSHDLQVDKAINQPNHSAVIHGHIVEQ